MRLITFALIVLTSLSAFGCSSKTTDDSAEAKELVLYCGRSESLAGPLVEKFEEATGINVSVKYGNTASLALAIQEEGELCKADVFWSQDAGALGALSKANLFTSMKSEEVKGLPGYFRHKDNRWVATSGRARVFAYAPARVAEDEKPTSVFDLTDAKWRGRVGWAPTNASFQSFVTAMRVAVGDERTEAWLRDMKDNGAKTYPKNTAIVEAIASGDVDLGLPNHYYLLRFKAKDANYPVEQAFFEAGDPGNLINIAGCAVLAKGKHGEAAEQFVAFLLSEESQRYFADSTHEYPVTPAVTSSGKLLPLGSLLNLAPRVSLNNLEDLDGSLELLRKVGLL